MVGWREIAAAEKFNSPYVSRVAPLTLLAPDIVAGILDGRQSAEMTLAALVRPFPVVWQEQVRGYLQGNIISDCTSSSVLPPGPAASAAHFMTKPGQHSCKIGAEGLAAAAQQIAMKDQDTHG